MPREEIIKDDRVHQWRPLKKMLPLRNEFSNLKNSFFNGFPWNCDKFLGNISFISESNVCSFIGQSVISCRMEGEGGNGGKRRERWGIRPWGFVRAPGPGEWCGRVIDAVVLTPRYRLSIFTFDCRFVLVFFMLSNRIHSFQVPGRWRSRRRDPPLLSAFQRTQISPVAMNGT